MRTPTTTEALTEIEAVASGRIDRDVCALSCLTKIEELSASAGDLGPAIYRACRSSHDATKAMKAVAALFATSSERAA
jgi:hypothetical protein